MRAVKLLMIALIITLPLTAQAQRNRPQHSSKTASNPTGTHMSETQQGNVDKLVSDLQAIKSSSQVTGAQKEALKNDLMAMVDGATKPDSALVEQLANDIASALEDGNLSNAEMTRLANDLKKVMNSANIPASEVNQAIADAQAILTASGIDRSDVTLIVNDMKAIASEAQKNAQKAKGEGSEAMKSRPTRGRKP